MYVQLLWYLVALAVWPAAVVFIVLSFAHHAPPSPTPTPLVDVDSTADVDSVPMAPLYPTSGALRSQASKGVRSRLSSVNRALASCFSTVGRGLQVQVLSVDDEPVNHLVVQGLLGDKYEVIKTGSGEECLRCLHAAPTLPEVVLLDVHMPDMNGHEVCRKIREQWSPAQLPIIMMTADRREGVILDCLQAGASDYMRKPLSALELKARISTQIALTRSVRAAMDARGNTEMLRSILPAEIITQLKQGHHALAQHHEQITVLFSDIKSFTDMSASWPTERIICMLNEMFSAFDELCEETGMFKVETIGDAYMIVSGHDGVQDHALRMMRTAACMLDIVESMAGDWDFGGQPLQIRIGIHTGPAHSGVVGTVRPRYTFFGDTINTASRMESNSFPMAVHVSESARACAEACYQQMLAQGGSKAQDFPVSFVPCGPRNIKGKGVMHTHLLKVGSWKAALAQLAQATPHAELSQDREFASVGGNFTIGVPTHEPHAEAVPATQKGAFHDLYERAWGKGVFMDSQLSGYSSDSLLGSTTDTNVLQQVLSAPAAAARVQHSLPATTRAAQLLTRISNADTLVTELNSPCWPPPPSATQHAVPTAPRKARRRSVLFRVPQASESCSLDALAAKRSEAGRRVSTLCGGELDGETTSPAAWGVVLTADDIDAGGSGDSHEYVVPALRAKSCTCLLSTR